jgi:hypothetical protein
MDGLDSSCPQAHGQITGRRLSEKSGCGFAFSHAFLFIFLLSRIDSPCRARKSSFQGIHMARHYTTVVCLDSRGRPCKAEVSCGGEYKGFSDPESGRIIFPMLSEDEYDVSTKRLGETACGRVRAGRETVLRFH